MGNTCTNSWRKYAFVAVAASSVTAIVIFALQGGNSALHLPKRISRLELHEHNHFTAVQAAQEQRKTLMKEMCKEYFPAAINETKKAYPKMHSSDDKQFLFCIVQKVASTSWKRILSRANGAPKTLRVHSYQMYEYVDLFTSLRRVAKTRVLSSYFKFMFVRHPFERLISAYKDKLVDGVGNNAHFRQIVNNIKRKYRTDRQLKHSHPTFGEFVKYLIDPRTPRPFDPHWRPYHELCQPCRMKFDFIGHYETLADDTRYVLDRLRIPADQLPKPSISHNSSNIVADMFSQLSQDEFRRLVDIYRLDFELFGYSPNIPRLKFYRSKL